MLQEINNLISFSDDALAFLSGVDQETRQDVIYTIALLLIDCLAAKEASESHGHLTKSEENLIRFSVFRDVDTIHAVGMGLICTVRRFPGSGWVVMGVRFERVT